MRFFAASIIALGMLFPSCKASKPDNGELSIETSNKELEAHFNWATAKAASFVMTGKQGVVDKSERSEGDGSVNYMPCYWAGYPHRTAFYIRDFNHQATGAHLLGYRNENFEMLKAFAGTSNSSRKWYPLWALNFDGSDYKLDYNHDSSFVREIPATFELVETAYKLYRWTGDKALLSDSVLWNFYTKTVTDFVTLHDQLIPNGVAEGDGSGNIFRGVATYNEANVPLVEAGDGIACQYRAFLSYANMLNSKGQQGDAAVFFTKANELKTYFNTKWGVSDTSQNYVRGYTATGEALTDFGRENSIYMLKNLITDSTEKNKNYLKFCAENYRAQNPNTMNIEGLTYLPDAYFAYNMVEEGWFWMKRIMDDCKKQHIVSIAGMNTEYPEVSYTVISGVIENMMGVEPDAANDALATIPRLPEEVPDLAVNNIHFGKHTVNIKHIGNLQTSIKHVRGDSDLSCTLRFYGKYKQIKVNGSYFTTKQGLLNGEEISYFNVTIPKAGTIHAEVI